MLNKKHKTQYILCDSILQRSKADELYDNVRNEFSGYFWGKGGGFWLPGRVEGFLGYW